MFKKKNLRKPGQNLPKTSKSNLRLNISGFGLDNFLTAIAIACFVFLAMDTISNQEQKIIIDQNTSVRPHTNPENFQKQKSEKIAEVPASLLRLTTAQNNSSSLNDDISFLNSTDSSQSSSIQTTNPGEIYTVKKGDSLFKIANQEKTTVSILASLNNLSEPYNLQIGQQLKLP
jgi:LysM repeat protein